MVNLGDSSGTRPQNTSATAAASSLSLPSSIFNNYPIISALMAFAIAQSIKLFTSW